MSARSQTPPQHSGGRYRRDVSGPVEQQSAPRRTPDDTGVRRADRLVRLRRRVDRFVRPRTVPRQALALLWLTALTLLLSGLSAQYPAWVPASSMIIVILLGGFLLRLRGMLLLYVVAAAGLLWVQSERDPPFQVVPGTAVVIAVIATLVALWVRSREPLGLQGTRGDVMLVNLRDALAGLGAVPAMPPGWHLEVELRPAHGDSFSGDLVVTYAGDALDVDEAAAGASSVVGAPAPEPLVGAPPAGRRLELVLVDVSGSGEQAGARSLSLSGALGGLLGAVPPARFLPMANRYLMRQDWHEGFATAVHVAVDLTTGEYRVASAGHPPAGTGVRGRPWRLLDGEHGPALGLLPSPEFPGTVGHLGSGEALVLYTDGLVETPGGDLAEGIDTLVSQVSAEGGKGFASGAAARVVEALDAPENDDRTLLLLWRD